MTEFKNGDKIVVFPHQWNITYTSVSGPVVGEIIRMSTWEGRAAYCVEHKTSEGKTNSIWTDRAEADNLIAHVGGPFKDGDRVVYTGEETPGAKGLIGTVKDVQSDGTWIVLTDLDFSKAGAVPSYFDQGYARNFSLYTKPSVEEPTEDTPANPELQALRERLLALAVKAYVDEAHQSIVETARMFENYITGGTK